MESQPKCKKSPAQSPINDRTRETCGTTVTATQPDADRNESQLSESSTSASSNDCKLKPSLIEKSPCGNLDSTQADLSIDSSHTVGKFVPCHQQPLSQGRPCERIIPCLARGGIESGTVEPRREVDLPKTRPDSAGKAHPECSRNELSETTGRLDSATEQPCRQRSYVVTQPTADGAVRKPEIQSSNIRQPHSSGEGKPCKHAEMTGPRCPSKERKCKSKSTTDDRSYVLFSGSKDEKTGEHSPKIHSTKATKQAETYKKCNRAPAATDTEKPVKTADHRRREQPSDGTNTAGKLIPIIPKEQRSHTEETRPNRRRCKHRRKTNEGESTRIASAVTSNLPGEQSQQTIANQQKDCKQTSVLRTDDKETPAELKTPAERLKTSRTKSIEKPCKNTEFPTMASQERTTEAKKDLTSEAVETLKQPAEVCPCNKTTDMPSDKMAEQLLAKRGTKKTVVKECSKTDEPEAVNTAKPCKKNAKITGKEQLLAKRGTKKTVVKKCSKTDEPEAVNTVKPCKKYAAIQSDKITAQKELTGQKRTNERSLTESSKTKEPTAASRGKPCGKNAASESDSATRPEGTTNVEIIPNTDTEFRKEKQQIVTNEKKQSSENMQQDYYLYNKECESADKYNSAMQSPGMKTTDKQKPCHPKTEDRDSAPGYHSKESKKRCKKRPESFACKQPTEKTAAELASSTDREKNDSRLDTQQPRDEVDELLPPCSSTVIPDTWTYQTSSLPTGQDESSSSKRRLKEPCSSANESPLATDQQVRMPTYGAECLELSEFFGTDEAEKEEPSSELYLPRSETKGCGGCPDTEKSKVPQTMKQNMLVTPEPKPRRELATKSRNVEEVNGDEEATATVQEPSKKTLTKKCWQKSPSQTKPNQAQNEAPHQGLTDNKTPCPKSRMPTSDQSIESTTRLIRRCKQERILKLFKYKKKLPCQSGFLAPESSASTVLSHQPSTDDQLSDGDEDSVAEAGKLTERFESAGPTGSYGTHQTKTAKCVQSMTTDPDVSVMRKVQSDDHDVMTHRQNVSVEMIMQSSEPAVDVSDSCTPAVTTTKVARADSRLQPAPTSKPVAMPRTIVEHISTPLEWDSSDNTSSDAVLKKSIPRKRDCSPRHQRHGGFFTTAEKQRRIDSSRAKSLRTRKMPCQVEEDPDVSDSWSSTEDSASGTSAPKNVAGRAADGRTHQDTDNKSNSGEGKASNKPDDSEWSDGSSSPDVVQSKPTTQ